VKFITISLEITHSMYNLSEQEYNQLKQSGASDADITAFANQYNPAQGGQTGQPSQGAQAPSTGNALTNFLPSLGNVAGGVANAVMHPIDTAGTIAKTAIGGVEAGINTVAGTNIQNSSSQTFGNVAQYFKNRYGSWDDVMKTANNDPAGFLLDISTLVDGGASIAGKAADLADIAKLGDVADATKQGTTVAEAGKTGEEAAQTAQAPSAIRQGIQTAKNIAGKIDPIRQGANLAGKILGKTTGALGKLTDVAFGVSTGKGAETARQAFEAGEQGGKAQEDFTGAMRGTTTPEQIVQQSKGAISDLYEDRTNQYNADTAKLKTNADVTSLNVEDVKATVKDTLKNKLDIPTREVMNPDGTTKLQIDFSKKPSLDSKGIQQVADLAYGWKDTTIKGINTLKQEIESFRKGGINPDTADLRFNKFITDTTKSIDGYLKDNVQGYAKMNENYTEATKNIKEIQDAIDSKKPQLAFQRLSSALRTDNEFKIQILQKVKEQTGVDLSKAVAGANLNTFMPAGLIGRGVDASIILSRGLASLIDPHTLIELAATSPRIVGEVLNGLGVGKRYADMTIDYLKTAKPEALQTAKAVLPKAGYYASQTQANTPQQLGQ
jgi:hypothetical protein